MPRIVGNFVLQMDIETYRSFIVVFCSLLIDKFAQVGAIQNILHIRHFSVKWYMKNNNLAETFVQLVVY